MKKLFTMGVLLLISTSQIIYAQGIEMNSNKNIKEATFGAGCFWCVEAVYELVEGVIHVESGYSGGHVENPSYGQVTTGRTGHVEVARIHFDSTYSVDKFSTNRS